MKKALILGIFSLFLLTATTVLAGNRHNECEHNCNAYPTVTPTVAPSVTPTPIVEVEPSVTPTSTPEATPTPEVQKVENNGPFGAPEAPRCENLGGWRPTITRVWREDFDTVGFEWTKPRDQADEYILHFGLSKDSLPYNKIVKGQSTTVDLPDYPNVHVWGSVQETDNGCVGLLSEPIDP